MEQDRFAIRGDRPLQDTGSDRLGFRPVARQIAKSLLGHASDNGLVVGLEGSWGSGKSSLLFLIESELRALQSEEAPTVINFRPWLIRERDSLLVALFRELTVSIDAVYQARGDSTRASLTKARDAAIAVRRFAKMVGRAGDLVQFAGDLSSLPPMSWVGKGLKAAGRLFGQDDAAVSLSASKNKLVKALRELDHLFVVTVDDVDRLEPSEALEVLRLIRSVADFPNVVYLVCYDSDVLAKSVEKTAQIENGHQFLEKIVQLTVAVPIPEPFQLRNWFADDLKSIAALDDEEEPLQRLRSIIDVEGGRRLTTPRSVVRALDAVRFMWPALQSAGADLADLVWLTLVKNDNARLYRWIEKYLSDQSAAAVEIASIDNADKTSELEALKTVAEDGSFDSLMRRHLFSEELPGVQLKHGEGELFSLFERVSKAKQNLSISRKRLASPDHYKLYFSLASPSYALSAVETDDFWKSLNEGVDQGSASFLALYREVTAGTLSKADVLLERLDTSDFDQSADDRDRKLIFVFGTVLDEAYRIRSFDRYWVNSIWDRAERLLPRLLQSLATDRQTVVEELFAVGAAISWLTKVFRHETFSHGRYGDQRRPESEWILTAAEIDAVTKIMTNRYRRMSFQELLGSIDPLSLLFAWKQGGDEEGPRKLVEAGIASDTGLVSALEVLQTTSVSSHRGAYQLLRRQEIDAFLNYDEAKTRIAAIAAVHSDLSARANLLSQAFQAGESW